MNVIDRAYEAIAPIKAVERQKARIQMQLASAFHAGDATRQPGKRWLSRLPGFRTTADDDMRHGYKNARKASRDLNRNSAIAVGARETLIANAVNIGLRLDSRIDWEYLGITPDEAKDKQKEIERWWNAWAGSEKCDMELAQNFAELQALVMGAVWDSGEVFSALPITNKRNHISRLRVQVIEADRVDCPPDKAPLANTFDGIELDKWGAPVKYHVRFDKIDNLTREDDWREVLPYSRVTGERHFLHLFHKKRPGQSRGMTLLAPVVEKLKEISDYEEYELKAALAASMWAVFIETETGDVVGAEDVENGGQYNMSPGAIIGLAPGEKANTPAPGRPNPKFEGFVNAILRQVGMGLNIPYELLVKHFSASYSASRAALLEAWKGFRMHRKWLADHFCQPTFVAFMDDMVATGKISLPGYFQDPLAKLAWLNAEWVGIPREEIDPLKPAQADLIHVNLGTKTRDRVIRELGDGDFDSVHAQLQKEFEAREEAGFHEHLQTAQGEVDTTPDEVENHGQPVITLSELRQARVVDDDGEELEIDLSLL